jgi:CheY-like chemotaxis protein
MNAGNSALDLVNQFLSFSRSQTQRRVPVEIDKLMSRSIKLVRMSMPETAEIRYTLEAGSARLDGDPSQIHMAVMNVLDNAAEAVGEFRGEITVETSIAMLSDEDADEFPSLTPGPYAKILVRDNGRGMAEDIQKRIFEPYFTTKQEGVGKGMGLPTARGIIRSHNGLITNASIPGEGTVFQMLLPVTVEEDYEAPQRSKNLPRGNELILVVDDEALISTTMKKMLMHLGYEVSLVKTAEEAWQVFEKATVHPDLVITDWALPDLPGDALAEKIRKKYPSVQVILYSAFNDEFDEGALKGRGIAELLGKPVEFEVLAESVRAVLDDTD